MYQFNPINDKRVELPNGVMTVLMPRKYKNQKVIMEVNEIEEEVKKEKVQEVLINIGFFVHSSKENLYIYGDKEFVATIIIPFNMNMVNRLMEGEEIEFVFWGKKEENSEEKEWIKFPNQRQINGFVIIQSNGWPGDPSIGWR